MATITLINPTNTVLHGVRTVEKAHHRLCTQNVTTAMQSRAISIRSLLYGATSVPPGRSSPQLSSSVEGARPTETQTSYLSVGYLAGAISSVIPRIQQSLQFASSAPVITEKSPTGVPLKAESKERVIVKKVSRSEVTSRTLGLMKKIEIAETGASRLLRVEELCQHIILFPGTRVSVSQNKELIQKLIEWEASTEQAALASESRQCLSLCGYQPYVKSRGINVLTIDGGGTRGMMGLEILEEIERVSGKKIAYLFDHIVGVSTGAIIASLLGIRRCTVTECRDIYMDVSKRLFSQNRISGVTGVIWSHSYYDTKKWVKILKEIIGEQRLMIDSSKDKHVPRVSIVSTIVNLPLLQPFVFRNYETPSGEDSHYRGSVHHPIWKAIQSSAAAPLYFEEVQLDQILLQDGGVIANNPTAIGLHEARLLWPQEPFHCVVSLGNGRSVVDLEPAPTVKNTRLQDKLLRIIDSATDTEAVHMSMHDLLPNNVYYRLNPYMTHTYGLDEIQPDKLEQMKHDAMLYVRRNAAKIESCAMRLTEEPTLSQLTKRKWYNTVYGTGRYCPQ